MPSYKEAGVDIDAGDELIERIKPLARATQPQYPNNVVAVFSCDNCDLQMEFLQGFEYSYEIAIQYLQKIGWKVLRKKGAKGCGGTEFFCPDCK